MAKIQKWSPNLLEQIKSWDDTEKGKALFIERHPEYPAYLLVNSFDPLYIHNLKGVLNEYRAVNRLKISSLLEAADENGYENLFFVGDPEELYTFIDDLDEPYPFDLNVSLKKFQLRGFNYTRDLPSAIINWSTGTGKSVYAVARAKYLLESGKIDKVIVLSKSHNKINWQRTFKRIGNLSAYVDDQVQASKPSAKREGRAMAIYSSTIFIVNYEKLRFRDEATDRRDASGRKRPDPSGDGQEILDALKGQRVLWIWDEMPNKMKSMSTAWYKGAEKILRKTKLNYQIELTAKKLDTDPENVYSCTKILDRTIWPNVAAFRAQYAKRMSQFSPWQVASWDTKKLPELGMRLAHITHIANKYSDPEIRAEFPEDHWEDVIIDMSPEDRRLYEVVEKGIIDDLSGDYTEMINKILPLQLICNNPALINKAQGKMADDLRQHYRWTDLHCAKLDVLRDMLAEIEGKSVIFTMFNDFGVKMLSPYLTQWGVSHVVYTGNNKQRQIAQDRFRADSRIKVFLSSDAGSDSIDLEQATTVINYDLPWNHSTLIQRVNRISRLTSEADHVFYYNLITANSLEERKLRILARKRAFEDAIDSSITEQSEFISHSDLDELRYIITGR
jgi:SNF2 family DNA or RNA helicase